MRSSAAKTPGQFAILAAIIAGCLMVAWLAIKVTAVEVLPPTQSAVASIAPNDPDRILASAMLNFILKRGQLDATDYARISAAARAAPLDGRPYMFVASRRLMEGDSRPIIPVLEAGRRLDPSQVWIRLYLLEQYLRSRRYPEASSEFAVLNRLVGVASGPIVAELARMATDPATAASVRQTLAHDPSLENNVLALLAKSGTPPQQIFAIASPVARAAAGRPDAWGPVLVASLAAKQNYREARAVWTQIYHVLPDEAGRQPYDGDFKGLRGSAPFGWTLNANEVGAADLSNRVVTVSYYGRQVGELANQLLVLSPGRYTLTFALGGPPPSNGGPALAWNIACDQHESPRLLDGAIPQPNGKARVISMEFTVPADKCPAQWLRLVGNPGDFPATLVSTVAHITVQPVRAAR